VHRLWPDPDPATDLDDAQLARLYQPPRDRPWLRVNFVSSLDGAVTLDGYSEGLSGPGDKRVFGLLRMQCDALLVGAGTLRNEGYRAVRLDPARRAWRREHGLAEYPPLVVVSGALALDPDSPALADAPVRPVVLTHAASPAAARAALAPVADVVVCGESSVDLAVGLHELHGRGWRQVLCEGGPQVLGTLTGADLVDELCLTLSATLAGPGAGRITAGLVAPEPRRLGLRHVLADGDMLLLRYAR
jgi:riboflavin biosynthesis pyrimidine reductase